MPSNSNPVGVNPQTSELELQVLRALCTLGAASSALRSAIILLERHSWCDPEHRIVFDALRRIHPSRAAALRDELPGMATRMGFPDVEWAHYFEPSQLKPDEFEPAVRAVIQVAQHQKGARTA